MHRVGNVCRVHTIIPLCLLAQPGEEGFARLEILEGILDLSEVSGKNQVVPLTLYAAS